jgi:hypothetical protein
MVTDTTRNDYKKAEGSDGLAAYLIGSLRDTLDILDTNTAKANIAATVDPAVTDDSADGYSVGSPWFNLTDSKIFLCKSAAVGAAVWLQVYPAVAADLGNVLTEEGDIPYWDGSTLAALKHSLKNYVLACGGHGEAPFWSALAQNGWVEDENTWLFSSADAPTYVITIAGDQTSTFYPGMRLKCTQGGAVNYFIVTAVAYSAPNTVITCYGGTDYALTNNAISQTYYSSAKAPLGFPLFPAKWSVVLNDETNAVQNSPTADQWYNPGGLSIEMPIGAWNILFKATIYAQWASKSERWAGVTCGLALATGVEPLHDFSFQANFAGDMYFLLGFGSISQFREFTTKTTYHLALSVDLTGATAIAIDGLDRCSNTQVVATCSYL